ncbi:MAG: 6-bladed beta-propeller [Acidobacteriota bacterium]
MRSIASQEIATSQQAGRSVLVGLGHRETSRCRRALLLAFVVAVSFQEQAFAQTIHPRTEYRSRPPGTPVIYVDKTARSLTDEQRRVFGQLSNARLLARIGVQEGPAHEMFGEIRSVVLDDEGHIYVLDSAFEEIRVFSTDGRFIQSVGGPGQGPGEFVKPMALAVDRGRNLLYVGDLSRRLHLFSLTGKDDRRSIEYDRSIRLEMTPEDICLTEDELVLHGMRLANPERAGDPANVGARILHVANLSGEVRASFGSVYESPNSIVNYQVYEGWVACDSNRKLVFLAPKSLLAEIRAYELDGRSRWITAIRDFIPIHLEDLPNGSRMRLPAGGWNRIGALTPVTDDYLLVQESLVVSNQGQRVVKIHSFLVSMANGAAVYVGETLPRILAANKAHYATVRDEPYPELTVWEYR